MKTKLSLFLLLSFIFGLLSSQVPQGFNYQAIARDGSGNILPNTSLQAMMYVQSFSTGGTVFWKELHSTVTTNSFGLFTLVVGKGTRQTESTVATFDLIDWSVTPKYLKTEIYYSGSWKDMGTSQLMSVPYAMTSGDLTGTVDKLSVKGTTSGLEDALFEVKNKDGQTIFAVYNEGVRIYVDNGAKGTKGGFAVGGFDMTKGTKREYFIVSDDSIRMYLDSNPSTKGKKSGFAVGGYDLTKGAVQNYLDVSADSIRMYIDSDPSTKKIKGGFAVGGYDMTKGTNDNYFNVYSDSTTIATSNQSKRVVIRNPADSVPLLNIDGSIKMGYDSIASNGIMGYNGSKFLTYEMSDTAWKQFVVTGIPEVITDSVYNISRNVASVSGNVIKDGGSEIVARGVCWSTSSNPTLMDSSLVSGNGKGHFLSDITGLKGSSTYYVRTFATNSKFTNYGEEQTINTLLPVLPSVITTTVTSITGTFASSGGNITDDGADNITARGVCWNITGNPDITDAHTSNGTGTGIFNSSMTTLQVNKTYFVRAYATNSVGTAYGETFSFATTDLPVLSTNPITVVTGNSATTGGNIFAGGELSITGRGVCWNTTGNPTLEGSHTENGTGTGSFVSNITGLSLGTIYFVRAYAANSSGAAYGNEYFFTTLNIPTITTDAVSLVTGISANGGGNISYNGGAVVTERGLCWNVAGNPTTADPHITAGEGSGTFTAGITGLTLGTTYYTRAYAINSIGTAYGNPQMFTTQNFAAITTSAITAITYTTATGGGNITSDGGALITERGICWNTGGNPVITDSHTSNGPGAGIYTSNITGLAANNTYYVKAYAINSIGTTYGQEVHFSTPTIVPPEPGFPVIGTINVTAGSNGFHTGGYISSDGGSAVTQRGVCWGTSANPTLADNYSNDGTGIGLYNSTVVIAGCGTTYYLRAYATNSTGTGYGNQLSVTSGLLPYVETTASITNITKSTAMSGGTITSDGGCTITERGICWNRFPNPTISNYKTISGSGPGIFTASLTGLFPNDTYYVRAYATNSLGTGYGPELVFTTQAGASGAYIGQFYAGGYVFYLDGTGDHGLVCAPSGSDPYALWGCDGTSIPGTQIIVGSGAANTATIIANCAEASIAARLCDAYESNGYTDWFLPSILELVLMYNNLKAVGIGGFYGGAYWSSSEYNSGVAYYLSFTSGGGGMSSKPSAARIRAVRAF